MGSSWLRRGKGGRSKFQSQVQNDMFFKPMSMNHSNAATSGTHLYSEPAREIGYDSSLSKVHYHGCGSLEDTGSY